MASYVVWDLRDLLEEHKPKQGWQRRVEDLDLLFEAADRGAQPVYPPPSGIAGKSGSLRATRARRLETFERDDDLFELVNAIASTVTEANTVAWAKQARKALGKVLASEGRIAKSDREFLAGEIEPFLRRLQRADQLEQYSPPRRSTYVIRR
jgi:hypothetical protein